MSRRVVIVGGDDRAKMVESLVGDRHDAVTWGERKHWEDDAWLDEQAAGAEAVVLCIGPELHADAMARLAGHGVAGATFFSFARGLDAGGRTVAEILGEALGSRQPWAVVSGPFLRLDAREAYHTFAEVGCTTDAAWELAVELFASHRMHLRRSADPGGICWAATLRDVYCISAGVADALELGDSIHGLMAAQAVREMGGIIGEMGGDSASAAGLAGLGSLIAMAYSDESHAAALGRRIVEGDAGTDETGIIATLETLERHPRFDASKYRFFSLIGEIVRQPDDIRRRVDQFLDSVYES